MCIRDRNLISRLLRRYGQHYPPCIYVTFENIAIACGFRGRHNLGRLAWTSLYLYLIHRVYRGCALLVKNWIPGIMHVRNHPHVTTSAALSPTKMGNTNTRFCTLAAIVDNFLYVTYDTRHDMMFIPYHTKHHMIIIWYDAAGLCMSYMPSHSSWKTTREAGDYYYLDIYRVLESNHRQPGR